MKNRLLHLTLLFAIVLMAAFTRMPAVHQAPDKDQPVPEEVLPQAASHTFTLTASDITASKDSLVCIEVKTSDFNKILSMQYSMNWDPIMLKFREMRAFGLPGMSKNNFGTHSTKKGILTFSWYDPNLRGMTKSGETKLYEVCFQLTGKAGEKTQFIFNGTPTPIEIANAAGVFLDFETQGGWVTVK